MRPALVLWPAGRDIYRIHHSSYGPARFNDSGKGNARFSPINDPGGTTIPILYGGDSFECAAMETVFRDVPHAPGLKTYDKKKLDGQSISVIRPKRDLTLINLSGPFYRRFGISRRQLIDSDAADYPNTRPWAEALHAQCRDADGLLWVSRQHDEAKALVVFGDRAPEDQFDVVDGPEDIVSSANYQKVLDLAAALDVNILA